MFYTYTDGKKEYYVTISEGLFNEIFTNCPNLFKYFDSFRMYSGGNRDVLLKMWDGKRVKIFCIEIVEYPIKIDKILYQNNANIRYCKILSNKQLLDFKRRIGKNERMCKMFDE